MITIYPAKRNRTQHLTSAVCQTLQALYGAVEYIEATGRSATFERATLEALQVALDENHNCPRLNSQEIAVTGRIDNVS